MPEFWIQLENHAWDVCPNNIDRMTGLDIQHREGTAPFTNVTLVSPGTGVARNNVTMFRPLTALALPLTKWTQSMMQPIPQATRLVHRI